MDYTQEKFLGSTLISRKFLTRLSSTPRAVVSNPSIGGTYSLHSYYIPLHRGESDIREVVKKIDTSQGKGKNE